MKKLQNYIDRSTSVITKEKNVEHLFTFKDFPVFFGGTKSSLEEDLVAEMVWEIDPITGIIQLSKLIPLDILYSQQHFDATGSTWQEYNNQLSEYVVKNASGNILEIGGGSGKLAKLVLSKTSGITYTVVEPNPTFEEQDSLKIVKCFFTRKLKEEIKDIGTVIFSQVYEHAYDPEEFLSEISDFLIPGGKIVFAYPNLEYLFRHKFTNAINFEHTMLMTDYYVDYFLEKTGFKIIDKIDYENHSHFYTVEKIADSKNNKVSIPSSRYEHYKSMFQDFVNYHKELVDQLNAEIENTAKPVYLFGAHIFSLYLIAFGLNSSKIEAILDNSPLKQGKRLYGTELKVLSPQALKNIKDPLIILKAGLYNEEIKADILNNINSETIFI